MGEDSSSCDDMSTFAAFLWGTSPSRRKPFFAASNDERKRESHLVIVVFEERITQINSWQCPKVQAFSKGPPVHCFRPEAEWL